MEWRHFLTYLWNDPRKWRGRRPHSVSAPSQQSFSFIERV